MTAGPSLSQGRPVKVAGLAILMGKRMGFGLQELDSVGTAALLDIGYVLLPEAIADGARAPSQEEARQVRNHPVHGERILKQGSDFAPEVIEAVLQHHENWDGSGYPSRLKGQEISTRIPRVISWAKISVIQSRPKIQIHLGRGSATQLNIRSSHGTNYSSTRGRWTSSSSVVVRRHSCGVLSDLRGIRRLPLRHQDPNGQFESRGMGGCTES